MKNTFWTILILLSATARAQTSKFEISGHVGKLGNYDQILIRYNDHDVLLKDSIEIINGTFNYQSKSVNPGTKKVSLHAIKRPFSSPKSEDKLILFVAAGEKIRVNCLDSLYKATISGSEESIVYQKLQLQLRTLNRQSGSPDLKSGGELLIKDYVREHPDFYSSLDILSAYGDKNNLAFNLAEAKRMFNGLTEEVRKSEQGAAFEKLLGTYKNVAVGDNLPDFTSLDSSGRQFTLSSLKGNYVFIDFWASWCVPCRREFPYLKEAYSQFKNKKFEIVGYSLDTEKSRWLSAMQKDSLPWIQVSHLEGFKDPVAIEYQISGIPANWLIDPDGKIIARNLRGEELYKKLEQLFVHNGVK